jgi:transcriptional regulator with XRE-family HTH domain
MASLPSHPLLRSIEASKEILARNLSTARIALGMSQEQLAEASGVSRATIIQLEAAEGDPRLSTIAGIAAALEVSPVFLFMDKDELAAIANASSSIEAERIRGNLSPDEIETMRRLLQSGIAKNRTKAVGMGVSTVIAAGLVGGIASAAIGTALIPGVGTALGAAIGALMSNKRSEEEKA